MSDDENHQCFVCGKPNINGLGFMRLCVDHEFLDPRVQCQGMVAEVERLRAELGEAQVEAGCLQAENDALNEQAITGASELERMQETIDLYKAENTELRAAADTYLRKWHTEHAERNDEKHSDGMRLRRLIDKPGAGT